MFTVKYVSQLGSKHEYTLCVKPGFANGFWERQTTYGTPLQFPDKTQARLFLARHGYDLPVSQTIFAESES